jgi:hypothetical protein
LMAILVATFSMVTRENSTQGKNRAIGDRRSRYRPRMLTLLVLLIVAAMLVLANLSFDQRGVERFVSKSYGWPFIWHRYVYQSFAMSFAMKTIGWYWSAPRLAVNIAIWLAILVTSALLCEWLLRRYRPRMRWSLRTMLAAVALAALFCGWFATAREKAKVQDELIAALPAGMGVRGFLVERWGPKWFDLIGADRFRRSIVFGEPRGFIGTFHAGDSGDERLIKLMARLPDLRSLTLDVDRLSPEMAEAINGMRQLRSLRLTRLHENDHGDLPRAHLPPIGELAHLEKLVLGNMVIDKESVAGLTNLKSLSFISWCPGGGPDAWHKCLSVTSEITQLEHLSLHYMQIHGDSQPEEP